MILLFFGALLFVAASGLLWVISGQREFRAQAAATAFAAIGGGWLGSGLRARSPSLEARVRACPASERRPGIRDGAVAALVAILRVIEDPAELSHRRMANSGGYSAPRHRRRMGGRPTSNRHAVRSCGDLSIGMVPPMSPPTT